MPIDYEVRGRILYSRGSGTVTPTDLLDHVLRVHEDPTVPRPVYEVWDGLNIDGFTLASRDVRAVVKVFEQRKLETAGARIAVVTQSALVYGMVRVAQAFMTALPIQLEVCETLEEAAAWVVSDDPAR